MTVGGEKTLFPTPKVSLQKLGQVLRCAQQLSGDDTFPTGLGQLGRLLPAATPHL